MSPDGPCNAIENVDNQHLIYRCERFEMFRMSVSHFPIVRGVGVERAEVVAVTALKVFGARTKLKDLNSLLTESSWNSASVAWKEAEK